MIPASDQEALANRQATDMLITSMVESFRAGSDGSAWELRLLTRPWGFHLQDITIPMALWHGDADTNSPIATGSYLRHTIPDASLTVLPCSIGERSSANSPSPPEDNVVREPLVQVG